MTSNLPLGERKKDRLFLYFLIGWIVLGLIQSYFSDVSGEEAYYWLFSQYLDWGYLDHPPMIGLVTAPGYWLIPNNLGLRLGMLITSVLTLIVIRKTLEVRDDKLFIWMMLGMVPFHAGALLVKTDVPLLLFVATFFYCYKQYLKNDDFKATVWLALSIALIMLSKHHGFLVVLFTVLSNVKLLTKKSFWITVGLTVVFMLPHTYWQYQHDFATIKFHLHNRIDMGFGLDNIAYYLGIQPIVFGPLIGFMIFAASYFNKAKSDFNRALKYTIIGVLIFFLVSTFKVEFHKHWTSILAIPLILLAHEYISSRDNWKLLMKRLSIATIVLLIPARIYLMYDFFPKSLTKDWDVLHQWDTWGEEVEELSGGLPVIFINHYERASRYSYLTGDLAHCYNTFSYRETQHDLWPLEEELQGKRVFIIDRYNMDQRYPTYTTKIGKGIHYRIEEDFRSFRKVNIELVDVSSIEAGPGEELSLNIKLINNYDYPADFSDVGDRQVHLNSHFLVGLVSEQDTPLEVLTESMSVGQESFRTVKVRLPEKPGKYDLRFSIQVEGIEAPINSKKYKVVVK